MSADRGRATATRPRAPARVLGIGVAVGAALATGGCLLAEPEHAGMTIRNESRAELSVFVDENTAPRTRVRPSETLAMATAGGEGACQEWVLSARTADGTDVATFGPPVCDGDEWVITQDDLDAALSPD